MRLALRGFAPLLPLAAILTWLLLHSVGPPGEAYVFAQRDVARVSLGEAALLRDVLQARAGLLRNYDPLVADINDLRGFAAELRMQARVRDSDKPLLDALVDVVARQEVALEQFKTDNALLQNSLSQFDALDTELGWEPLGPSLATAVAALGNAILHLTRDPSVPIQQAVQRRLGAVNAAATDSATRADIDLLITHANLLSRRLPVVDEDLRALFSISTYSLRQQIRASQDARRRAEESHAAIFRLALFGVAIVLAIGVVRAGLQRRAGLRLLRQRAELDSLLAGLSTSFIAAPIDRYEAMLDQMLARLGAALGADRAYLMVTDASPLVQAWCRPGVAMPALWPQAVLQPALVASQGADDLIEMPTATSPSPSALRKVLRAAGNRDWYGVVLRLGEERAGLLGFDCLHTTTPWPRGGAGAIRMAGEVVQNAIQRRRAALERLELEAKLNRARRLEAIGTLASGIAHNFNNVIGAVLGHAEMASELIPADTPPAQHVLQIHRAGERAQELVTHILDFSMSGVAQHRSLSVDDLLSETVSMLHVSLPSDVVLVKVFDTQGQRVHGDAVQLQQVVLNLVRNAAQSMAPAGGTVRLTVDALQVGTPRSLTHGTLKPGRYVHFDVVDEGIGMDAETLRSIFNPFFTTRPGGTGLGLATVREIVHEHDGVIDVHSVLRQGTKFEIWIPTSEPDAAPPAPPPSRRGSGQVILLLGSEQNVRLHDEEILAALGYEPASFPDREAALTACQIAPDSFDAIVLDVTKLDAVETRFVNGLHKIAPRSPIVLVSREPVPLAQATLAGMGILAVLRRPLRSTSLAAVFERCFGALA